MDVWKICSSDGRGMGDEAVAPGCVEAWAWARSQGRSRAAALHDLRAGWANGPGARGGEGGCFRGRKNISCMYSMVVNLPFSFEKRIAYIFALCPCSHFLIYHMETARPCCCRISIEKIRATFFSPRKHFTLAQKTGGVRPSTVCGDVWYCIAALKWDLSLSQCFCFFLKSAAYKI